MLKGIPKIISPDLLHALMSMGHGDDIVLSDGNFPAASIAKRLIRSDGVSVAQLLEALLPYFPLDHAVEQAVTVMSVAADEETPPAQLAYEVILRQAGGTFNSFEKLERTAFYARAGQAYAVVITSDLSYKGNIILKKGVVR